LQLLFDNCDQHIGAHCAPDLGLHSVLACAQKVLDAQVLFDPLEEEFDLPAVFVQGCDGGGRQTGVVGQKDQSLACGGVGKPNTPNVFGIVLDGIKALERNTLIGNHSCASSGWGRVDASGPQVVLGARDVKGTGLMKAKHGNRWQMLLGKRPAGKAIRALIWLGPEQAPVALQVLKRKLPNHEWEAMRQARARLPSWMAKAVSEMAIG